MNTLWSRIDQLSHDRTIRLDASLKLAKEFNVQARSRVEWLNNAEHQLKQHALTTSTSAAVSSSSHYHHHPHHHQPTPIIADNQHDIIELIEVQQNFVRDLQEQESLMRQCLELGQRLLNDCIPEAVINLKHWIVVLQSRWDDVNRACDERTRLLNEQLQQCKENELALDELLAWLQGAEATLTALEQKPIAQSLDAVEQLLVDHQEFLNDMQSRQSKVERITKMGVVRDSQDIFGYHHNQAAAQGAASSMSQDLKKKSSSIKT